MVPDSLEYKEVRNKIYEQLRREKHESDNKRRASRGGQVLTNEAYSVDFGSFFNLLIVVPEEIDCLETVCILNYFGFPFNLEEDDFWHESRK